MYQEKAKTGKLGNNYKVDDVVQIARTTDKELDGQYVVILGKFGDISYIIMLEKPYSKTGNRAIVIIESCLDKTSNH